jgi:hypothetical protein
LVDSKVTVLKSYPFIGLMGYSAGRESSELSEIEYDHHPPTRIRSGEAGGFM